MNVWVLLLVNFRRMLVPEACSRWRLTVNYVADVVPEFFLDRRKKEAAAGCAFFNLWPH